MLVVIALTATTVVSFPVHGSARKVQSCGKTTLQGTIKFSRKMRNAGKPLECGPGQRVVVRKALADGAGRPGRRDTPSPMLTSFAIADRRAGDREAPARA